MGVLHGQLDRAGLVASLVIGLFRDVADRHRGLEYHARSDVGACIRGRLDDAGRLISLRGVSLEFGLAGGLGACSVVARARLHILVVHGGLDSGLGRGGRALRGDRDLLVEWRRLLASAKHRIASEARLAPPSTASEAKLAASEARLAPALGCLLDCLGSALNRLLDRLCSALGCLLDCLGRALNRLLDRLGSARGGLPRSLGGLGGLLHERAVELRGGVAGGQLPGGDLLQAGELLGGRGGRLHGGVLNVGGGELGGLEGRVGDDVGLEVGLPLVEAALEQVVLGPVLVGDAVHPGPLHADALQREVADVLEDGEVRLGGLGDGGAQLGLVALAPRAHGLRLLLDGQAGAAHQQDNLLLGVVAGRGAAVDGPDDVQDGAAERHELRDGLNLQLLEQRLARNARVAPQHALGDLVHALVDLGGTLSRRSAATVSRALRRTSLSCSSSSASGGGTGSMVARVRPAWAVALLLFSLAAAAGGGVADDAADVAETDTAGLAKEDAVSVDTLGAASVDGGGGGFGTDFLPVLWRPSRLLILTSWGSTFSARADGAVEEGVGLVPGPGERGHDGAAREGGGGAVAVPQAWLGVAVRGQQQLVVGLQRVGPRDVVVGAGGGRDAADVRGEALVVAGAGEAAVLVDLRLHGLVPLGAAEGLDLLQARAAVLLRVVPAGREDALVDGVVVGSHQVDVGRRVRVVVGLDVRGDGAFQLQASSEPGHRRRMVRMVYQHGATKGSAGCPGLAYLAAMLRVRASIPGPRGLAVRRGRRARPFKDDLAAPLMPLMTWVPWVPWLLSAAWATALESSMTRSTSAPG
ncbi:9b8968d5-b4cb-4555-ada2-55568f881210 [Thermothielavioides terrestris]|uniref:9b8968d5-b4cb-4555-ada2-55568f881210 n=1 Tax=Thermothielavioides terrestris TaxID=2587410 RepID=A0A446BKR6_9PEZI|nr:9b8968d5-b4cb-4555-ada2-55568f881210 [Thermothielavioides terrestris]